MVLDNAPSVFGLGEGVSVDSGVSKGTMLRASGTELGMCTDSGMDSGISMGTDSGTGMGMVIDLGSGIGKDSSMDSYMDSGMVRDSTDGVTHLDSSS